MRRGTEGALGPGDGGVMIPKNWTRIRESILPDLVKPRNYVHPLLCAFEYPSTTVKYGNAVMIRQLTLWQNFLVRPTAIGHLIPLKPLLTLRLGKLSAAGNVCRNTFRAAMAKVAFNST